ncbi:aminoacyl-tRNA deacylase [Microbispora sp. H10670]|uniref:aminoacyl-tRNA deacylase n=1 Tax=Microbispora sp. H10670 TaxID=2729108 RepID=UPI0016029066|nr:YbaK/EbsC family protein [Microbispora sp. H10670]
MKDALAIHRWLLAHQIHHEIVRLPRPLTCSDELPEVLGVAPETCLCVSLFEVTARSGTQVVAVVSTVGRSPGPAAVASLLRTPRVRPASANTVNSATDYADGLVCPLLLPDELTVLVDQRLRDRLDPDDVVHTATGERRTALRLRAIHLFDLVAAKAVDIRTIPRRGAASLASPMRTA